MSRARHETTRESSDWMLRAAAAAAAESTVIESKISQRGNFRENAREREREAHRVLFVVPQRSRVMGQERSDDAPQCKGM
jgi:hypothetical protein